MVYETNLIINYLKLSMPADYIETIAQRFLFIWIWASYPRTFLESYKYDYN